MNAIDAAETAQPELVVGRYSVFRAIGRGGMAQVHLGRLAGPLGFSRSVAIKRIHPHLAREPNMVAMFIDEARLASRVQHPNVVAVLDILHEQEQLLLVMEFVLGSSLAGVLAETRRRAGRVPVPIAARVMVDVLAGLHAAHGASDTRGNPLQIVHRDVTPHNVLVGIDGLARVADFGIAKAAVRLAKTLEGNLKGKVRYMAPEQLLGGEITHRVDIYAAGVTLWELLTSSRRFEIDTDEIALRNPRRAAEPPSTINPDVPPELDQLVLKALKSEPAERFADALEMSEALSRTVRCASANDVASWVADVASERVAELRQALREIEQTAPASTISPSLQELLPEYRASAPTEPDLENPEPSSDPFHDEVQTTIYRAEEMKPTSQRLPAPEFTEHGTEIMRPAALPLPEPEPDEIATAVSRFQPVELPEPPPAQGLTLPLPVSPPLAPPAPPGPPQERPSIVMAFVAGGLVVLATVLLLTVVYQCATGPAL